jgi:hypothetical protein
MHLSEGRREGASSWSDPGAAGVATCPTSDHTRTGLNAATDMTGLRFALNALDEIAWFFSTNWFMRVSNVADAFPKLLLQFGRLGRTAVLHAPDASGYPRTFHLF